MAYLLRAWLEDHRPFSYLMEHLYDGLYIADTSGEISFWNHGAQEVTGYTSEFIIGNPDVDNALMRLSADGKVLSRDRYPLLQAMQDGQVHSMDLSFLHVNGHRVPVTVRAAPIIVGSNEIIGGFELVRDNSYQVAALEQIETLKKMAFLDALTGVGNRRYTESKIQSYLDEFRRHNTPFGLLFLDIDHFKNVNDTFGHDIGDQVLKMVAATVAHNLGPMDYVGRYGGEEFIVLVSNVDSMQLLSVAERLRRFVMHSTLSTDQGDLGVTASFGATMALKTDTTEGLMQRGDKLLYQSKTGGRNRVTIRLRRRARNIVI